MPDEHEPTAAEPTAAPKKYGWMMMVKAIAFVSIIVLLEVVAASMFVPTAEETVEIAEKLAVTDVSEDADSEDSSMPDDSEGVQINSEDMLEVFLGSYHVVSYNPESGSSLNVDMELFGTVIADEESEFLQLYEANQNRIKEQVLITVRGADISDLTDSTLGLIKRKILEKTNLALGKPLVRDAIFSKFTFVER